MKSNILTDGTSVLRFIGTPEGWDVDHAEIEVGGTEEEPASSIASLMMRRWKASSVMKKCSILSMQILRTSVLQDIGG